MWLMRGLLGVLHYSAFAEAVKMNRCNSPKLWPLICSVEKWPLRAQIGDSPSGPVWSAEAQTDSEQAVLWLRIIQPVASCPSHPFIWFKDSKLKFSVARLLALQLQIYFILSSENVGNNWHRGRGGKEGKMHFQPSVCSIWCFLHIYCNSFQTLLSWNNFRLN